MMIVGGILYSAFDLAFDSIGYLWAVGNLLCSTGAGLWGKHLAMDLKTEQTALGLTVYQNLVSVPIFAALGIATGEAAGWGSLEPKNQETYEPRKVLAAGLFSCILCVTIGMATFEFQRLVSQATVVVANVSYKLITLLLGIIVYGNTTGAMGFVGLIVAQGAAIVYVYERQFGQQDVKSGTRQNADGDVEVPLTKAQEGK